MSRAADEVQCSADAKLLVGRMQRRLDDAVDGGNTVAMGGDAQTLHVRGRPAAGGQKQRSLESVSIRVSLRVLEGKHCLIRKQARLTRQTFLLFQETGTDSWIQTLRHTREVYADRRDHFLKFIRYPEALAEISSDPLNDDPESPWNTVRQDEVIRAEIEQDVKRLPDEANYHDDGIQMLILDVLFIYCKLNPGRGGYRQGMHELLAPIVHVLEQDAVNRESLVESDLLDAAMLETLDAAYIEHDAFTLFSKLMERAQFFYEVKDVTQGTQSSQETSSAIVERSKHIHEVLLNKIDPDLAAHLTNIEILPQIFLMQV
ncbi:hypothetical protein NLG97_g9466 [Lecanicillium saksenae]|uniref:Uncharacterized protein n=1 Tax=Lecanicillium saksenae TaxID=468837 RepID=A0ACC1QIX1_9HYPO|nr:hypothetical protein NLG97_g9466 [Lecanicillium saksenae]